MDWGVLPKLFATLLALIGAFAVVLGLPGTFIAWVGVFTFSAIGRFTTVSAWVLLLALVGCLVVELADNLLSGLLVKKFGAGKGSMLMAWLGGIAGAVLGGSVGGLGGFFGSALFGVLGAFAGSYIAVYLWERYRLNRLHGEASKVAFGTVVGRLLGVVVKLGWIGWLVSLVW